MALVENTLFGKTNKVDIAIERLRGFEPDNGYWLAFSGGKDSVVIKRLAEMAGVEHENHYSCTSVDPPELVRFVKSMPGTKAAEELDANIKYKEAYIRTFDRMLEERKRREKPTEWKTGEEVLAWQIGKGPNKQIDGQIAMELEELGDISQLIGEMG